MTWNKNQIQASGKRNAYVYAKLILNLDDRGTPFSHMTSFRSMFYTYFHAIQHRHTNIFSSVFSTDFVLKCAAKVLKICKQIKTECPKKKWL